MPAFVSKGKGDGQGDGRQQRPYRVAEKPQILERRPQVGSNHQEGEGDNRGRRVHHPRPCGRTTAAQPRRQVLEPAKAEARGLRAGAGRQKAGLRQAGEEVAAVDLRTSRRTRLWVVSDSDAPATRRMDENGAGLRYRNVSTEVRPTQDERVAVGRDGQTPPAPTATRRRCLRIRPRCPSTLQDPQRAPICSASPHAAARAGWSGGMHHITAQVRRTGSTVRTSTFMMLTAL